MTSEDSEFCVYNSSGHRKVTGTNLLYSCCLILLQRFQAKAKIGPRSFEEEGVLHVSLLFATCTLLSTSDTTAHCRKGPLPIRPGLQVAGELAWALPLFAAAWL